MSILLAMACLAAQDCCSANTPKPWPGYDEAVRWEKSLDEAQKKARAGKKLILYYVLVGDLDKEGC